MPRRVIVTGQKMGPLLFLSLSEILLYLSAVSLNINLQHSPLDPLSFSTEPIWVIPFVSELSSPAGGWNNGPTCRILNLFRRDAYTKLLAINLNFLKPGGGAKLVASNDLKTQSRCSGGAVEQEGQTFGTFASATPQYTSIISRGLTYSSGHLKLSRPLPDTTRHFKWPGNHTNHLSPATAASHLMLPQKDKD